MKTNNRKQKMIKRRQFLKSIGIGTVGLGLSFNNNCSTEKRKPNVLLILADDFGWRQLGCYGSTFYKSPNIDKLASEGMRFTDAYAACPVCSPTRAAIMTGKYPGRLHVTDFIPGGRYDNEKLTMPQWQKFLPLEEKTIAEVLKEHGYATAAFGKWHLSITKKPPESEPYNPGKQGFNEYFVTYKPTRDQDPEKDAHNVEAITSRSLDFMEQNKDNPFFLYVSHNTIHDPLREKKELIEKYKANPQSSEPENNPVIGAMIETLDKSCDRLLAKLKELDLENDTIVIWASDNGGLKKDALQTPLRGGKAQLYEGGIRVPFMIRWPGKIKPQTECPEPTSSVDIFPTVMDMLGIDSGLIFDGASILPVLTGSSTLNREAIYWHYPHYHGAGVAPSSAIRAGDYKLIELHEQTLLNEPGQVELYNLKEDISETKNLAEEIPEKTRELRDMLNNWKTQAGVQMPTVNTNYSKN
jgi:arylsulfatase A